MAVSGLSRRKALTGTGRATSNLETSHSLPRASISSTQGPFFSYSRLAYPKRCWLIGRRGYITSAIALLCVCVCVCVVCVCVCVVCVCVCV